MISVENLTHTFGSKLLFKDVNLQFTPGNCYGLIGANGSGKSTFLRILSGELDISKGNVSIENKKRLSFLRQDHYAFDEFSVMQTVLMGHKKLYDLMIEKDALEAKTDMSDDDGMRLSEIYGEFGEFGGYEAESDAGVMLEGLGISTERHGDLMKNLEGGEKVRVLLAQALFGNPDILLLDEPTNHLDIESITWLEDFLVNFQNTVIVVSHDRHFLNQVCTHIADIDYGQIKVYVGNYDFWYEASQMAATQRQQEGKQREQKIAQLQEFIRRFSSNVAKAKQATSRKKLIEKLTVEELPASTRKFPYVEFKPERECGKMILSVKDLTFKVDDEITLENFNLNANSGDKIAFIGYNNNIKTAFFDIISGKTKPISGSFEWGITIKSSYMPRDNSEFFDTEDNLIVWLSKFLNTQDDTFVRGCLGRMLFSGEEAQKPSNVLSGGEKQRCMISRSMLSGANVLILDEPTNHLDLESITALNKGLMKFSEVVLFGSHDHEFLNTVANRIVEFTPNGVIDRPIGFDEYFEDGEIAAKRDSMYKGHKRLEL
ncbi:MAG: ATP-binding cassette domain-containing protein [Chitinispirillales bacterium]|jgi:ATPase subunit of ABC transporter with duplicated ATPase domains|nr:ATP-binding cassette domain-containing protein [Chitinispirillales bacterium]